jgi:hypothetical protein
MKSSVVDQLRALHPDATDEALEFHAHIVVRMVKADAPTGIIIAFSGFDPVEPGWLPILVCLHSTMRYVYGLYPVDGVDRCVQCIAGYRLWLPEEHLGLLEKPAELFATEFAMGEQLAELRRHERMYPNARLRGIIAAYEPVIDDLSDVRTESEAYRNSPPEWEGGGRCGY